MSVYKPLLDPFLSVACTGFLGVDRYFENCDCPDFLTQSCQNICDDLESCPSPLSVSLAFPDAPTGIGHTYLVSPVAPKETSLLAPVIPDCTFKNILPFS